MVSVKCQILVALVVVVSGCTSRGRRFEVDLGPKPKEQSRLAMESAFTDRHGLFFEIPESSVTAYASAFQESLHNQEISDTTNAAPKKQALGDGLEQEYSIGEIRAKPCLRDLTIGPGADDSQILEISFRTCGLHFEVRDAKAEIRHTGALASKPVTISIGRLSFQELPQSARLTLKARISFDIGGRLVVERLEAGEGFDSLIDADRYDIDTDPNYFEKIAGDLGVEAKHFRISVLSSLLKAAQPRLLSSLKRSITKAGQKSDDRLKALQKGYIGLAMRSKVGGTQMALQVRPKGLVGGKGFFIGADVAMMTLDSNDDAPCKSEWTSLTSPRIAWLSEFKAQLGKDDRPLPTASQPLVDGRLHFPLPLLNAIVWHILGDKAECRFALRRPSGATGVLSVAWEKTPTVVVQSSGSDNGLTLLVRIPSFTVRLQSDIVATLRDEGINIPVVAESVIGGSKVVELQLGTFEFPVFVKLPSGPTSVITAAVNFETLSPERYSGLSQFDWRIFAEDLKTAVTNNAGTDQIYGALARAALNQYIAPILSKTQIAFESSDKLKAAFNGIENIADGLRLSLIVPLNNPGRSLLTNRQAGRPVMDEVVDTPSYGLLEKPRSFGGFPILLGESSVQAPALFKQGLQNWICSSRDRLSRPSSLASERNVQVILEGQECQMSGDFVEVSWAYEVAIGAQSVSEPVSTQRIRVIRSGKKTPMTQSVIESAIGNAKDCNTANGSRLCKWSTPEMDVEAVATCVEGAGCSEWRISDLQMTRRTP